MTLKITPLSGTIGAEISGIDLRNLSNSEFDAVHRAFLDHAVLCFRDQDLTPDDQIAFARRWGENSRSSLSQRLAGPSGDYRDRQRGRRTEPVRRLLAYGSNLHTDTGNGNDALCQRGPAGWRRYDVRQPYRCL